MEKFILPRIKSRLILAIDEADDIWQRPFKNDFFGMLRYWVGQAEEEHWEKLRLILATSIAPSDLIDPNSNQSPFNITDPIRLDDLDMNQVSDLAKKCGLEWKAEQIRQVMDVVGGQPYLVEAWSQIVSC